jgi:hypothetical protein
MHGPGRSPQHGAVLMARPHAMRPSQKRPETITTIGIDLGKNTFHFVGLDKRAHTRQGF